MLQCDEKDFKPITTFYCTNCEQLKKELKKIKQEKKKLSIKYSRVKNQLDESNKIWLSWLCKKDVFGTEKEIKKQLESYDKDKIIELYLQMKFERDLLKTLIEVVE